MQFIERGGGLVFKQPFQLSGATAFCFGLRGNVSAIQEFCDATVNLGSSQRYLVATPLIAVSFMNFARVASLHPSDKDKGAIRETEVNFTIPLITLLPPRVIYYMASIWVDDAAAICAGREIYGYPKQFGEIKMPLQLGAPASFEACSQVIQTFGNGAMCSRESIVKIQRMDGGTLESGGSFTSAPSAFGSLMTDFMGADLTAEIAALITPLWDLFDIRSLLTLAFFKQFRHVAKGADACYQAVNEASFAVTDLREAHLLGGKYEIEIPRYDSVPLAKDFGLAGANGAGDVRQTAAFAYYLDFDFRLEAGKEVWVGH